MPIRSDRWEDSRVLKEANQPNKSKNPNAMPLILTHEWPGSIVEFLKVIGPAD